MRLSCIASLTAALCLLSAAASAQEASSCPADLQAPCAKLKASVEAACFNSMPGDLNTEDSRATFHKTLDALLKLEADAQAKQRVAACVAKCEVAPASEHSCWRDIANKHGATRYEPKYEAELHACMAEHWVKPCERKLKQAKEMWAEYANFVVDQEMPVKLQTLASVARSNPDTAAAMSADIVATLDDIKQKNQSPALKAAVPNLDARRAEAAKAAQQYQASHNAKIAGTTCPKGKVNNPALLKEYRAQVEAFYGKTPDDEPRREVHQLQIQGKAAKKYDRWQKTSYETTPLSACVEILDPKGARCYVWSLSIQRSKVDGQSWSGWDTVLVGERREMMCSKLK